MSQDERDKRQGALQLLNEQEQEARTILERSRKQVQAKQEIYRAAKNAFEKLFWSDKELKKVVQRNIENITDRRHRLEAGVDGGHEDDLFEPLELEYMKAPEPEVEEDAGRSNNAADRSAKKKGIAKKSAAGTKKGPSSKDDHLYRIHKKQVPGMFAADHAISGRTRRLKPAVNGEEQDSDGGDDEEGIQDIERNDEEEEGNEDDQDRWQREGSQESILSHITVARRPSRDPTPLLQNAEDFGYPYDQQFGDDDILREAMEWANQPWDPGFGTNLTSDNLQMLNLGPGDSNFQGQPIDNAQWRESSPALSIATSNGSGLFVSETIRYRPSRTRAHRQRSPIPEDWMIAGPDMPALPFPDHGIEAPQPLPNTMEDNITLHQMLPPGAPASKTGGSSPGDSLFGESISVRHRSQSVGSLFGESGTHLPTPDPSGSDANSRGPVEDEPHDRARSRRYSTAGLFVSGQTPDPGSFPSQTPVQSPKNGRKRSSGEHGQYLEGKPAKKRSPNQQKNGKNGMSTLDSLRAKWR